jgi:hypothetical protein
MRNGRFVFTANDGVTIEDWYKDGKLHRDDGPATVISDGYKAWYWKGFFHRTNGPARIWGMGQKNGGLQVVVTLKKNGEIVFQKRKRLLLHLMKRICDGI